MNGVIPPHCHDVERTALTSAQFSDLGIEIECSFRQAREQL
jgi:hypothetical protein